MCIKDISDFQFYGTIHFSVVLGISLGTYYQKFCFFVTLCLIHRVLLWWIIVEARAGEGII